MDAVLQREVAREKANRVRMIQVEFRRNVKASGRETGLLLVCEVIADPSEDLAGMRVGYLLRSLHRIGSHRAEKVLRMESVSPTRKLRDLTERQRDSLIERVKVQLEDRSR